MDYDEDYELAIAQASINVAEIYDPVNVMRQIPGQVYHKQLMYRLNIIVDLRNDYKRKRKNNLV